MPKSDLIWIWFDFKGRWWRFLFSLPELLFPGHFKPLTFIRRKFIRRPQGRLESAPVALLLVWAPFWLRLWLKWGKIVFIILLLFWLNWGKNYLKKLEMFFFLKVAASKNINIPISIYGVTCMFAAVASMMLPIETKGRELKESHSVPH